MESSILNCHIMVRMLLFRHSVMSNSLQLHGLFATPWTAASLMSTESVMPSHHLILCCPLFLLPSIFPNIRVFSNELALHIR